MMNKIKNAFKSKITLAVIACLLLVGVFAGLTIVSSGSDDSVITIETTNINHADSARLLFQVSITQATEVDVVGKTTMKFWNEKPQDASAEADYTTIGTFIKEENGAAWVQFESFKVAPKAMTQSFYCAAAFDGKYSDVKEYSVFQYLCEMQLNNPTDEQQALYAAMEDYIKYAQLYLGVTDQFPSPDSLAYIDLEGCYIDTGDGAQVSHGLVPAGDYKLHFTWGDNAKVVDQNGNLGDYREDGYWYANLVASQALSYSAVQATRVVFNVAEGAELVLVTKSTVDGSDAFTVREAYGAGEQTIFVAPGDEELYYAVPTGVTGKAFSGWSNDDGATVTDTAVMKNVTLASPAVPTPVFKTETEFADADRINTLAKWYNLFAQTRNDGNTNQNMSYDVTESGSDLSFSRMYWSMNLMLQSTVAGVDYNDLKVSDFFKYLNSSHTNVNFYDHLQYSLVLGAAQTYNTNGGNNTWNDTEATNALLAFGIVNTTSTAKTLDESLDNQYYLALRKDRGDANNNVFNLDQDNGRCLMSYDEYNNIQFLIDVTTNEDGTITASRVSAFINGNFVGSEGIKSVASIDYANATMNCKMIFMGRAWNTTTTMKDFMVKEFD